MKNGPPLVTRGTESYGIEANGLPMESETRGEKKFRERVLEASSGGAICIPMEVERKKRESVCAC